ncbi:hypothetical protein SprV_0401620600 [Sparganum proliferum]
MPQRMITITPKEYCIISNPVKKDENGNVIMDEYGQASLAYGDEEYRFAQSPFPLYPGEELLKEVTPLTVLSQNKALLLSALVDFKSEDGVDRVAGELWLFEGPGIYKPRKEVQVLSTRTAEMISPNTALLLRALMDFTGKDGQKRVYGEEWLVKSVGAYMIGAYEERVRTLEAYHLDEKARTAGEEWMLTGPLEYVPPIEVEVVTVRQAIPLDENEGIYVREKRSGQVRAVIGSTYMLNQDEELWPKKLSPAVEQILRANKDPQGERAEYRKRGENGEEAWDPTRVVSYRVPHNAAVQIYDYKGKKSRVVFGPERVMLGPDEEFTLLSLSGGKPKRTNMIKTICLLLGPDFCTDVLVVETADHARLSIQLSYNWQFEVPANPTQEDATKLFSQPDFVGDFCKAIAARVRGIVASVNFDRFHKNSASLIRQSVFGVDAEGKIRDRLVFPQNNLVVTSVDVQAVEPVDQRTRDALQKSVQLAIEITSNSQEAAARQEAERLDQEARGKLERQRIEDEAKAEEARRGLLELQVQLAALESTGQAKAEAQSRVDAALISSQAEVEKAKLEAEAEKIKADAELERLKLAREAELDYIQKKNQLNLERKKQDVEIETSYFLKRVEALGAENLRHIACAGPERDVRMLRALNLKSTLITDGRSPVNLLDATSGLIGQARSTIHVRQPEDEVVAPEPVTEDDDNDE